MLSMLAPVVLLFMGGLVAMILLAIYLPMFDLINADPIRAVAER